MTWILELFRFHFITKFEFYGDLKKKLEQRAFYVESNDTMYYMDAHHPEHINMASELD